MHDEIAHWLELHVARNGADGLAVDFKVDEARKEAAGLDMGFDVAVFEGEELRLLLVAIDDTGNEAFAANCAGGPLACPGLSPPRARDLHEPFPPCRHHLAGA
jgi:hypothetical protein